MFVLSNSGIAPVIHSEIVSELRECFNIDLEEVDIKKEKKGTGELAQLGRGSH